MMTRYKYFAITTCAFYFIIMFMLGSISNFHTRQVFQVVISLFFIVLIIYNLRKIRDNRIIDLSRFKDHHYFVFLIFLLSGLLMGLSFGLFSSMFFDNSNSDRVELINNFKWYGYLLFGCVIAPIFEELFYRVILFDIIQIFCRNKWLNALICSLIFGIIHGSLFHLIFGSIFSLIMFKYLFNFGKIQISILLHIGYNLFGFGVYILRNNETYLLIYNYSLIIIPLVFLILYKIVLKHTQRL